MSARTFIDELAARVRLSEGQPTLLLLVFPEHDDLTARQEAVAGLLEQRGLRVSILQEEPGPALGTDGPARWVRAADGPNSSASLYCFQPQGQLALRAAARTINAQREDLRSLKGPLLLLVSARTEKDLREHAPDFYSWTAERYAVPPDLQALWLETKPAEAALSAPAKPPIRFLHLSDLHLRKDRGYDQDRVLRGLLAMLGHLQQPLDLIFLTGDLAHSGHSDDYGQVVAFLKNLLRVTQVDQSHVFVVPGNHDADRRAGQWLLRTLATDEQATEFFTKEANRRWHVEKFAAYGQAMKELLGEGRALGLPVGVNAVEVVEVRGERVAVASFNSAWFAVGDDDQDKLWMGEAGVDLAGQRIAEEPDVAVRIALFHHPLEWLNEQERGHIEDYLDRSFDLVLRGHLHKDRVRAEQSARGGFVHIAAPAGYQGSRWPNGCFVGEIDAGAHSVRLSPYAFGSGADPWTVDGKVFPNDPDHGHVFYYPKKEPSQPSLVNRLAGELEAAFLTMDEQLRLQILNDLGVKASGDSQDHVAQNAYQMLRRQGRLDDLWDAVLSSPAGTSPGAFWLSNGVARHFPSVPSVANIHDLLQGFAEFWRTDGTRYLGSLRHAPSAPGILMLAYLHRVRPGRTLQLSGDLWNDRCFIHVNQVSISMPSPSELIGMRDFFEFKLLLEHVQEPSAWALTALDNQANGRPPLPEEALVIIRPPDAPPLPNRTRLEEVTTPKGRKVWALLLQT